MRVVAGTARGRRLVGPPGAGVRPTTDRVREAIFNSLTSLGAVEGAAVADLFAGTGACGIEALSRGATSAVFVDSDPKALAVVRTNLASTGFTGDVVRADVLDYLRPHRHFDLVFADPPYDFDSWAELLRLVDATIVVCESDRPVASSAPWSVVRERKYGGTFVTIFERA